MWRCAILTLLILSLSLPCSGQELKPEVKETHVEKETTKFDARAAVEALANSNRPPKHRGERHTPIFDKDFDWEEDARAWRAVTLVMQHADEAWPELVGHLKDNRYCITYEAFSGYTYDHTVGLMCRQVILHNLTQGYYRNVHTRDQQIHLALQKPVFLRDVKALKPWCEARAGKKLYELQIEMCEWATTELAKPEGFHGEPQETLDKLTLGIEKAAKSLLEAKKPVLWEGSFKGEVNPRYSSERAEAIRKKYAKGKPE